MIHHTPETLAESVADLDTSSVGSEPVLFAGTPEIAADCLRSLLAGGVQIAAVLTRPDAPVGRKKRLTPSPVAQAAEEAGLPVIRAARVDASVTEELAETGARLGVVVAYGALLPQPALDALPLGWVNLHYSWLPKYRGAAPVQHSILGGEEVTAATVFQLEAGMDTGPIHGLVEHPLPPDQSAGSMLATLTHSGSALLRALLPDLLAGTSEPQPQQGQPSQAPKLSRGDAFIDPSAAGQAIIRRINATIPEPGAWTFNGEDRVKLGVARAYTGELPQGWDDAEPGEILEAAADRDGSGKVVVMKSGDGAPVVLSAVQPAGKKMLNAADWFRGLQGRTVLGPAAGSNRNEDAL